MNAERSRMDVMRPIAQWASIVLAPLVFLTNLSVAYALVPLACAMQRDTLLHLSNGVSLVLVLTATLLAWHSLRSEPPKSAPREAAARMTFLSHLGIWISALAALAIGLQWSAQWWLDPCFA
jgi:hypothetical protein